MDNCAHRRTAIVEPRQEESRLGGGKWAREKKQEMSNQSRPTVENKGSTLSWHCVKPVNDETTILNLVKASKVLKIYGLIHE